MADDILNPKQEAFCLFYVETGNGADSYRRAYGKDPNDRDNWIYVEACQMLDVPKIRLRIEALQEQAAQLSLYTLKSAFDEYEEARQLANKTGNPSAAVSAVAGKVKLFGLDKPAKYEHTGKDGGPIQGVMLVPLMPYDPQDTNPE